MRFLADMNITFRLGELLRPLHDIVHLREQGLQTLTDEEVIQKACAENRILLTNDLHMGRLVALGALPLPSVITFRLSSMQARSILPRLLEAVRLFEAELAKGAAVTVTDQTIRCRSLPISRG